jgi:hypothetical protein
VPQPTQNEDPWGGLPAPWEPLPEWMTNAFAPVTTTPPADLHVSSSASPYWPAPANGVPVSDASSGASQAASGLSTSGQPAPASASGALAYFADESRTLPTPSSTSGDSTGQAPSPEAVEPDLDALARQVYTILRNRLSAERRRLG